MLMTNHYNKKTKIKFDTPLEKKKLGHPKICLILVNAFLRIVYVPI